MHYCQCDLKHKKTVTVNSKSSQSRSCSSIKAWFFWWCLTTLERSIRLMLGGAFAGVQWSNLEVSAEASLISRYEGPARLPGCLLSNFREPICASFSALCGRMYSRTGWNSPIFPFDIKYSSNKCIYILSFTAVEALEVIPAWVDATVFHGLNKITLAD